MSLNSLASSRIARDIPTGRELTMASEDAAGKKGEDVQNALSALVEYVPAETITLYLAVISALPVIIKTFPMLTAAAVYVSFGILTPVLFILIYMGKRHAAGKNRWPGWEKFPYWPMVAATIAFFAWGLAVPDGPFLGSESGRVISGLVAIFASVLLGVLGRLFTPKS